MINKGIVVVLISVFLLGFGLGRKHRYGYGEDWVVVKQTTKRKGYEPLVLVFGFVDDESLCKDIANFFNSDELEFRLYGRTYSCLSRKTLRRWNLIKFRIDGRTEGD